MSANGINNLRDIPVIVKNGTQEYELTADYGEAPGKIFNGVDELIDHRLDNNK